VTYKTGMKVKVLFTYLKTVVKSEMNYIISRNAEY